jgi:gas vesicle protein
VCKTDYLVSFVAGLGIGVAAALLLAPESGARTRRRIVSMANRTGETLRERAESFGYAAKEKIDDAADAARSAASKVVDRSRDVAHRVGRTMEETGKQLQEA